MVNVCPLCEKRVSDWQMAAGKTVLVAGEVVHKACAMDHDLSIHDIEKRVLKEKRQ